MPIFTVEIGDNSIEIELPGKTHCLQMSTPKIIAKPKDAILESIRSPISSPGLAQIINDKGKPADKLQVSIVISDNTRPVPYTGDSGILAPIISELIRLGIKPELIVIIVATGTHRALTEDELIAMLDPYIFEKQIKIVCHDCKDKSSLRFLGTTSRGTELYINKLYFESDIKILTGLVESHFMAGVSGGRKSICPGLIGEGSTHIFHGPEFMASPNSADLILEGNPCHEEALEVAKMAGADFIVNVTLDNKFRLTGVYSGDLEAAHIKAVEQIQKYVTVQAYNRYDIVVTHAGFVGINHYQAAKAGVVAIPILKPGSKLIMIANTIDKDPVGSAYYRTLIHLLTLNGPKGFIRLITSKDWRFIPEQWQVQMWSKLFSKISIENFTLCAPHISKRDAGILPGIDGNMLLPPNRRYSGDLHDAKDMAESAVAKAIKDYKDAGIEPSIAFLKDGPYGIPVLIR
ncbi:MAG: nickel-dependent lactate racemase [Firmicutes bacterium]|nr:nickel-dependent lactate racemase [Bacillota bacterium]